LNHIRALVLAPTSELAIQIGLNKELRVLVATDVEARVLEQVAYIHIGRIIYLEVKMARNQSVSGNFNYNNIEKKIRTLCIKIFKEVIAIIVIFQIQILIM
jgi:hypothetical protein